MKRIIPILMMLYCFSLVVQRNPLKKPIDRLLWRKLLR